MLLSSMKKNKWKTFKQSLKVGLTVHKKIQNASQTKHTVNWSGKNNEKVALFKYLRQTTYLKDTSKNLCHDQSSMKLFRKKPQRNTLIQTTPLINDLVSELPKGIKAALYADDLVIWCKEEYATTATYRMQLAAD